MSDHDIQHKPTRRRIEASVDFDFSAIEPEPERSSPVSDVVGFILEPMRSRRGLAHPSTKAAIVHRLMVVAMHSNPELFAGKVTIAELALRCGVSVHALHKHKRAAEAYARAKRSMV